MSVHVRPARLQDAAAVLDILNPIIQARCYTVLDAPFTLDQEQAFIQAFPDRGVFHVAEDVAQDGQRDTVGFQTVEPFADYTHAFDHVGVIGTFVRLECRRQGVGRALFAATFEVARASGYEKLFTFIREDNQAARAAYQAQGFREIGVASRHAKIDGRYVDEIMVELFL